jgi:replicative DNA helicase
LTQPCAADVCVEEDLRPEHFYAEPARWVYAAIADLHSSGRRPDTPLVKQWLESKKKLQMVDTHWLNQHILMTPWVSDVKQHIAAIKGTARLRALIAECQQIAAEAYEHSTKPEQFIQDAESRLYSVCQASSTKETIHRLGDSIKELFEQVKAELVARQSGTTTRLLTGLTGLDKLIGGILPGQLVIVAGRPSMGKTAFALNIGASIASQSLDPKRGVHIISAETRHTIIAARILGQEGRIETSKILSASLNNLEYTTLTKTSKELTPLPITTDDRSSPTLAQVRSSIRRAASDMRKVDESGRVVQKLGAVVVDYLQLCKNPNRSGNREQEVGGIAYGLLEIAKDFDVPVIALAQLSRECEKRTDKRPQMSDLRESGNIEQAADLILGLYRDEHYNPTNENKGIAEVLVEKNKNGATGIVKVHFEPTWMRFSNLEYGEEP